MIDDEHNMEFGFGKLDIIQFHGLFLLLFFSFFLFLYGYSVCVWCYLLPYPLDSMDGVVFCIYLRGRATALPLTGSATLFF